AQRGARRQRRLADAHHARNQPRPRRPRRGFRKSARIRAGAPGKRARLARDADAQRGASAAGGGRRRRVRAPRARVAERKKEILLVEEEEKEISGGVEYGRRRTDECPGKDSERP